MRSRVDKVNGRSAVNDAKTQDAEFDALRRGDHAREEIPILAILVGQRLNDGVDLIELDFPIQKRIVKIGQPFRRIDGAADNFSANQPECPDLTRLRHLRRDGDRERGNVLRLPDRKSVV